MPPVSETQQERAIALLKKQGMLRLSELKEAGITAATVSRMKEKVFWQRVDAMAQLMGMK
jgi:ABC-type metal ion transport system substrate-binding protein